jgi:hypothetical protein
MPSAISWPSSAVRTGSMVPGSSGSPVASISRRALALFPICSMTVLEGPMSVMPWSAQISAK